MFGVNDGRATGPGLQVDAEALVEPKEVRQSLWDVALDPALASMPRLTVRLRRRDPRCLRGGRRGPNPIGDLRWAMVRSYTGSLETIAWMRVLGMGAWGSYGPLVPGFCDPRGECAGGWR